jgi:hypothetical protein
MPTANAATKSAVVMVVVARVLSKAIAILSDDPVRGHRAEEHGQVNERREVQAQRESARGVAQQVDGQEEEDGAQDGRCDGVEGAQEARRDR